MKSKDEINWCGYKWVPRDRWLEYKPEADYSYYDEDAVEIKEGCLLLKTHYHPKYFEQANQTILTGVGLVSCTEKFRHGYFEIEAKLPRGEKLWPAFWMWSWETYPPEIDIFEGYSGYKNYLRWWNPFKRWKVQTNAHYGLSDDKKMVKAKNHCFSLFKNPSKHFVKYGLLWTPDKLEFYYNKRLVRRIKDPEILKWFEGVTMMVVLNNQITREAKVDVESVFSIDYFMYVPLEKLLHSKRLGKHEFTEKK